MEMTQREPLETYDQVKSVDGSPAAEPELQMHACRCMHNLAHMGMLYVTQKGEALRGGPLEAGHRY